MKKILLISISLFPLLAHSATWEHLFNAKGLGSVYYSPSTISTDALGRTLVWTKTANNGKGNTMKVLYALECDRKQLATPVYMVYNSKGILIDERNQSSLYADFYTPQPDSFGSNLIKYLCVK